MPDLPEADRSTSSLRCLMIGALVLIPLLLAAAWWRRGGPVKPPPAVVSPPPLETVLADARREAQKFFETEQVLVFAATVQQIGLNCSGGGFIERNCFAIALDVDPASPPSEQFSPGKTVTVAVHSPTLTFMDADEANRVGRKFIFALPFYEGKPAWALFKAFRRLD